VLMPRLDLQESKATGEWQCSCPGWIMKKAGKERSCKHLQSLLPVLLTGEKLQLK